MKIGIYGGSFNPIHRGHTSLAKAILAKCLVDELWLMVSPLNPLKCGREGEMADYVHRVRMAEIAAGGVEGLRVSDFESRMPVPSYMYNTLQALGKEYGGNEFVLVIGADNWRDFNKWYRAEDIVREYGVLVYRRPGCEMDEEELPEGVRVVDTELYDISSTQIRESLKRGECVGEWLDGGVEEYIREKGVYK